MEETCIIYKGGVNSGKFSMGSYSRPPCRVGLHRIIYKLGLQTQQSPTQKINAESHGGKRLGISKPLWAHSPSLPPESFAKLHGNGHLVPSCTRTYCHDCRSFRLLLECATNISIYKAKRRENPTLSFMVFRAYVAKEPWCTNGT